MPTLAQVVKVTEVSERYPAFVDAARKLRSAVTIDIFTNRTEQEGTKHGHEDNQSQVRSPRRNHQGGSGEVSAKPTMTTGEVRQHSTLLAKAKIPAWVLTRRRYRLHESTASDVNSECTTTRPWKSVRRSVGGFPRVDFATGKVIEVRDQTSSMWGRPSGASYTGGDLVSSTTSPKAGGRVARTGIFGRAASMNLGGYDQIVDEQYSTIVRTDTGSVCPVPIFDDVTGSPAAFVESRIVGDATQTVREPLWLARHRRAQSSRARFGSLFDCCRITGNRTRPRRRWRVIRTVTVTLPATAAWGIGEGFVTGSGSALRSESLRRGGVVPSVTSSLPRATSRQR